MPVEVDCTFDEDGRVRVRRIRLGWADADGRHVLIMLSDGVHELLLRADTLTWELRELSATRRLI